MRECASLVELLRWRVHHQADQPAYLFLADSGRGEVRLTYGDLDRLAQVIGGQLQALGATGERVLLLYPPGLAYVAAFFGCLYAGSTAVPLYPPRPNRPDPRLQAVLKDSQAALALTDSTVWANLEQRLAHTPELAALQWLVTDTLAGELAGSWRQPELGGHSLAFLQYTSGSTASPKGVMVSHGNLLHNLEAIRQAMAFEPDTVVVSWLPTFHDMGLVGGMLAPLYAGCPGVLLSPLAFLQQPVRWLEAISAYRGTISGGPNFAYELCARTIRPEQVASLDLSSWRCAFNGAEPVRPETLERFEAAFKACGFRARAFYPCYGLAEATLLVSGGLVKDEPVYHRVETRALEQGEVVAAAEGRRLVGGGRAWLETNLVIADPETRRRCPAGTVGEIWVSGGSVAQGYWNRPQETVETFQAHLAETGEGPFLRTGDLGFLQDGELFITGRIKDVIIIRGRNYYPQDIELSVARSHPALQLDGGAAFSILVGEEERLVIVQEVARTYLRQLEVAAVVGAIRQAVAEQHDLQVEAIVLLKPGSLPKTSSGKIQRQACRAGFLEGSLAAVGQWRGEPQEIAPEQAQRDQGPASQAPGQNRAAIQAWLIERVARRLNITPETIDPRSPFAAYGLDSVTLISLSGELGSWLDRPLLPTLAYDYPSIEALARYLAAEAEPPPAISASGGASDEPIAIIGLGCRFPGATTPEAFWQLLREGLEVVGEIPANRWEVAAFYDPQPATPGKMYTRAGGFLEQIDQFEPQFFGISPREARGMDPQQRLLLETGWEALEHAGLAPDQLRGSQSGVFVGISTQDYARFSLNSGDVTRIDPYNTLGNSLSIAAGRLAYTLGWHGPAMQVDTACSSSLVALHLACQSLRSGECRLALAGGVNLILRPEVTIGLCQLQALSVEGHCRTFDARADGYVRSEGCGMVVLKRWSDAVADGDQILALVRSSALNHDGPSNGLTAPNGLAQRQVIRQALANGRVEPAEVSYVEAHGTGTVLGDPIELTALAAVLGQGRLPGQPLVVGSVKTNIGHLEAAAGVASLIKTVLALQHEVIPPHLHFTEPNPHIPWAELPVLVPTTLTPWPAGGRPRLAGISSFGFSGTNVHVIIEEAPAPAPVQPDRERPLHLLALSARTEGALRALANQYAAHLAANPALPLADVCFTANTGRSRFQRRLNVMAGSTAGAAEKLAEFAAGREVADLWEGQGRQPGKLVFLFTGQGAQYVEMGRQLYETQPVFRQNLERCAEILQSHLDQPLLDLLYPARPTQAAALSKTAYTQPALFALEYSLARLWQSWGVEPDLVLGHSLGEYVAACIARVFSLEEGLKLVAARGRLMEALPQTGLMVALLAGEAHVRAAIAPYGEEIAVAAINSPEHTVVSGKRAAVQQVVEALAAAGVSASELGPYAFHSALMEPLIAPLTEVARQINCTLPQIKLISNLTGELATAELVNPAYWARHMRETVRFAAGIKTAQAHGGAIFLEIGPKPVLVGLGRTCLEGPAGDSCLWLPSLRQGRADWPQLLSSLAQLSAAGLPVDWAGFEQGYSRRKVSLPTYPFQRQRYWSEQPGQNGRSQGWLPLIDRTIKLPLHQETVFETEFSRVRLAGQGLEGQKVAPEAASLAMALSGARLTLSSPVYRLDEVVFTEPFPEVGGRTVQLVFAPAKTGGSDFDFRLISFEAEKGEAGWASHATGRAAALPPGQTPAQGDLEAARLQCQEFVALETLSPTDEGEGPGFCWLEAVWRGQGGALGRLRLPEAVESLAGYEVHPGLLAACFQLAGVASAVELRPLAAGTLTLYQPLKGEEWWGYARQVGEGHWDIELWDPAGQVIMALTGCKMGAAAGDWTRWLYTVQWQPHLEIGAQVHEAAVFPGRPWLILADEGGVGEALAGLLRQQGQRSVLVFAGEGYRQLDQDCYRVNPDADAGFQQLLGALPELQGVVHLWGLDGPPGATIEQLEPAARHGCGTALRLAQALLRDRATPPGLWLVTRAAQAVHNEDRVEGFMQAALWGLGRVIALEHPELNCMQVDLDGGAALSSQAQALCQALAEPAEGRPREAQVAWRNGVAYVARLTRLKLQPQPPLTCQAQGTYLISGGWGGLGLLVARWLVDQGARHLLLVGRSQPKAEARRQLEALAERGVEIKLVQADVAEAGQVAGLLQTIEADQPLRGVFHLAGVLDDGVLWQQDWDRFVRVFRPKVWGAWNLHSLTQALPLDFFVLFSSAAALFGSPGQANYGAANACLDALAHYRRARKLPALSLNWGPWAEVGLAAQASPVEQQRMAARGQQFISPQQGLYLLDRLLQQEAGQVAAIPIHWPSFWSGSTAGSPFFSEFEPAGPERGNGAAGPPALDRSGMNGRSLEAESIDLSALLNKAPAERERLLTAALRDMAARILGAEPAEVSPDEPLPSLGLDSLMAVELKNRLRQTLGLELLMTKFLSGLSLADLAAELAGSLADASAGGAFEPVGRDGPLPLSFAQQRLWFLDQLGSGPAYNIPAILNLSGPLDLSALEQALQEIVRRHEVLRTVYTVINDEARQVITTQALTLPVVNLQDLPPEAQAAALDRLQEEAALQPFDLSRELMLRASLLRLGPDNHRLLLTLHHIAADGWSLGVLVRELAALYNAFVQGQASPLPRLPLQYADFAYRQREWLQGEALARQLAYWQRQLAGAPEGLPLPTDHPRPAMQSFRGGLERVTLSAGLTGQLKQLSRRSGATLFMTLLAAFKVLLWRYSGQAEVLVGTPIANRNRPEIEPLIGFFANTLVLRTYLGDDPPFQTLLERVSQVTQAAYEHQDLPFERVVEALQPERTLSHNPLVQLLFVLQNAPLPPLALDGLAASQLTIPEIQTVRFDLELHFWEAGEALQGYWLYNTELFEAATIRQMAAHFQTLLAAVVATPDRRLSELPLLSEAERRQLWLQGSRPSEALPEAPVHELFEAQVAQRPEAVAVVDEARQFTYRELNVRANQVAHMLRRHGVGPETRVAIYGGRGIETVVAVLAVLKAGGAFIPLEAAYPQARLAQILDRLKPQVLLTEERWLANLPPGQRAGFDVICWDAGGELIAGQSQANPERQATAQNLAYISYGSGPGRMVEHGALSRRLGRLQAQFGLSVAEGALHRAAWGQETAVWEILWPLLYGGRLVIAGEGREDDPLYLRQLIKQRQVSLAHFTPSVLAVFLDALPAGEPSPSLRWVLCSGEALSVSLVDRFFERLAARLAYLYGHPEAGGEVTCQLCQPQMPGETVPLGYPNGNGSLYLLDKQLQPVPVGASGEIYIAGTGRGYWAEPAATARDFIPQPGVGAPGQRLFKTGDLGRWRRDGALELAGAVGRRVWLGGSRVDLAEVEAALLAEAAVAECRVIVQETELSTRALVAYVVPNGPFSLPKLQAHLAAQLPAGLRPAALAPVSNLPLRPDGTVDEPALKRLAIITPELARQLKAQVRTLPEIQEVAVLIEEESQTLPPLHLADLLPQAQTRLPGVVAEPPNQPAPETARPELAQPQAMAFSDGGPLLIPEDAPRTLTEALLRTAARDEAKGICYIQADGSTVKQSYADLLAEAKCLLSGLMGQGLGPGDRAILQIESLRDYFPAFWACVLGGITPVTVAIAPAYTPENSVASKLMNTWQLLGQPPILASDPLVEPLAKLGRSLDLAGLRVLPLSALRHQPPAARIHPSQPQDVIFFQLTSGSTGVPKAIQETHQAIIAHIHGSAQFNAYQAEDVSLNWLPMDHVVPILTYHLKDVYLGCQQIQVPTATILAEPLRWLDLIERYRVTHSWSPNFGFKLVSDSLAKAQDRSWDLSSIKFLMNAGEQVTLPVIQNFLKAVAPFGVPAQAMQPAFGMAEVCTCMTYQNNFEVTSGIHWLERASLEGRLRAGDQADPTAVNFVDLGPPIPGVQIRVVDQENRLLPEGVIGRFQIKGAVVTPGYYRNEAANQEAFVGDGWFNSGDLGFILNGRLTITGREKEMIIIRGTNYYCYEIEDIVNRLAGVEPTYVGACALDDPKTGTEELAIFFTPTVQTIEEKSHLIETIRSQVASNLGISPAYVVPVAKADFPKTTSGKIQRTQLKKWLAAGHFQEVLKEIDLHLENSNTLPDWFYRKLWRPKAAGSVLPQLPAGCYLVFLDASGLGAALCAQLERQGRPVARVEAGVDFEKIGEAHYRLGPDRPEHYQRLLESLAGEGRPVAQALHLWSYTPYGGEVTSVGTLEEAQSQGLYSLLALCQALVKTQGQGQPAALYFVASHSQLVLPTDSLAYEKATVLGLLKTIPQEIPWLACRHIDLPFDEPQVNAARLLRELQSRPAETEVAYREGRRLVPRLEKVELKRAKKQPLPFKAGGMYLLSGGLGGIGLQLAGYLLKHYQARLLLVGRSALPENGPDGRLEAYRRLQQLEGDLHYQAVDVGDRACLQQAVEQAQARWGCELDGVIHLAGIFQERPLAEETPASLAAMLRPKMLGAWNLHQLLKNKPDRLFMSFASVNGFFGGVGVGAYAAANSFLTAFADFQAARAALDSYCFSWSMWDELGMSRHYHLKALSRKRGYYSIPTQQGLHSLLIGLSHGQSQWLIGLDGGNPRIRSQTELKAYGLQKLSVYFTTQAEGSAAARLSALELRDGFGGPVSYDFIPVERMPVTGTGEIDYNQLRALTSQAADHASSRVAPRTETERLLASVWQGVLGLAEVGIHDNFFRLGGDSLLATQLISQLRQRLALELPLRVLFEEPTVAGLARRLELLRLAAAEQPDGTERGEREEGRL